MRTLFVVLACGASLLAGVGVTSLARLKTPRAEGSALQPTTPSALAMSRPGGADVTTALPSPSGSASPNVMSEEHFLKFFAEDGPADEKARRLENAIQASLTRVTQSAPPAKTPVVTIDSLECRLRLCRISLIFDSIESDRRVLKEIFLKQNTAAYPHGFGTLFAPERVSLPDGRVGTRLYLATEGELPLPS
jgi:hypothetical protein